MTLKERARRIKDWCVEHKKPITIAALSVVGCGATCYVTKKIYGLSRVQLEETLGSNDLTYEDLEVGMFMNGVRKQFLSTSDGGTISDITDTFDCLNEIVGSESGLTALQNGSKVFVVTQGVAATRGTEVIEAVRDHFPDIDDLEIWVGGTINSKE